MREIKFRGLRTDGKGWVYGNVQVPRITKENPTFNKWFMWDENNVQVEVIPETVGQFWRNVNGQELYDGDIFESRGFEDKPKWVVQYRDDEAKFCIAHPEELNLKYVYPWQSPDKKWWDDFGKDIYIIGNIHENPELLS